MPDLDTNAEEIEKVEPALDAADASKEAEQSADANSSTATDAKTAEKDTLSVVRDVVDARTGSAASSADSAEAGQKSGAATPKEPDNENYTDVPFHKHPRFQHVVSELKTARTDQQRYQNVENFLQEQGLSGDEAANLLVIGGLIKTNPAEAWKAMKPVVEKVLIAAGELLPEDLKAMVDKGEMKPEVALEVSRSRAAVQSTEARVNFDRQRQESRQQSDARNAILGTVSSWEAERKLRDPNFDAKQPALQREIAWLQTKEGRPNTPEGVRAQLQKAYDTVSAAHVAPAPVRQQRPAIRPVTGGQVNGSVRPEIKSTLDAVNAVVARRAG
ncbi:MULTISPECIES: hypothetical protein [unclassified Mesorhizobium]|uniref:hypothetical protein n=1 Tax=unclassified Mesorhizobium TaxID=325217 RepID=UPI000FDB70E2|nr:MULTISPECIES: hypothetical protein [unclassified Mesorhizobium]TGT76151.1 hypothetical protein EN809_000560 [Mesorhizobium sp. M2E.F.Ca.ET.166.01.1.1]TGW02266.1 hypothetical protein EN797_000560 [Mesorhizobium sp. M2E.F.Ca.ET.154.01.1.1]